MTKLARLTVVLCILIMTLLQGPQFARAQVGGAIRYPQTGHTISNDFLAFYQRVPNPEQIYGYPITEAFQDETSHLIVQYFQKARFELHPDAIPELRVQLTPLGQLIHNEKAGGAVTIPANFPACRSFIETGFQVCYTFLEFFNAKGGVAQFGYPISNFELQNERIVQYFQRARFEWHPELPPGRRVMISDLGAMYFQANGENPNRLRPAEASGSNTLETILNLRARAFTQQAVTDRAGNQTIFVVVQAQDMQPVSGAQVVLNIRYPDGQEQQLDLPEATDRNGIAHYTYPFVSQLRGPVQIHVTVKYGKLEGKTSTSYRIWY